MQKVFGLFLAVALLAGGALPAAAQYQYDYLAAQAAAGGVSVQTSQAAPAGGYQPAPGMTPPAAPAGRPTPRIFDEVKIGAQSHDVTFGERHLEPGNQINGEILFVSPDFLHFLYSPRPHLGASGSLNGETSYGYGGLTWTATLFRDILRPTDSFFVNGSLGGAIHDGYIDHQPPLNDPLHKKLGSRILFRESAEAGYGITEYINVSVLLDHISNANLGTHNAGISNLGGRVGFKF